MFEGLFITSPRLWRAAPTDSSCPIKSEDKPDTNTSSSDFLSLGGRTTQSNQRERWPPTGGGGDGAAGGDGGGRGGQQQQQPGFGQTMTGIIRMFIFFFLLSKFLGPKKPTEPSQLISNLFQKGESMDMWLYFSEHEKFSDFNNEGALIWHETGIAYAIWSPESTKSLSVKYHPSEAMKHNGSLYAHVFFARSSYPPDPTDPEYQPTAAFGRIYPKIVLLILLGDADTRRRLLSNSKDDQEGETASQEVDDGQVDLKDDGLVEWISYWKPNITINLVDDITRYPHNVVPPNIAPYLYVEPSTGNFHPTVFCNEFWLLREKLIPINESVTELTLNLERVFLEGNPYFLAITMVVTVLHSVFDFLAFKNDIQFWNKNKSMEGLSAKSVVVNFISQLIVFLYLLNNETSWMILASSGIGCCIEFWKIGKAMHLEIDRSRFIPLLRFRDRESYAKNKTKEYDDLAMKYLSYVLFFLAACFSIYSLMYEPQKGWFYHDVSTIVYKLQAEVCSSYALEADETYKFLNTIIDALFAFVIKMPMLHLHIIVSEDDKPSDTAQTIADKDNKKTK
ncbi:cleft lip and palate transmembrane protein 1 [Tripterygium wilfordii]|uniref:Cleft lip and palate transmembrane protein 1 n=1 Tax=Tripterygium wilfordii TaxID=458696 RepID=A0A7J7DG98_TRIWF|nr:cleft lip and palate transmembrane protein 1 [Tripterygium wilfordii]